jgi:hypothetical protein
MTYSAAEAILMPLCSQSFDNCISDWLLTLPAFGRVTMGMTIDTPSVSFFLDERRGRIERLNSSQYTVATSKQERNLTSPH